LTVRPKSREETPKEGLLDSAQRHPALHNLMCIAQFASEKSHSFRKINDLIDLAADA
jgi:hypothetical protein